MNMKQLTAKELNIVAGGNSDINLALLEVISGSISVIVGVVTVVFLMDGAEALSDTTACSLFVGSVAALAIGAVLIVDSDSRLHPKV